MKKRQKIIQATRFVKKPEFSCKSRNHHKLICNSAEKLTNSSCIEWDAAVSDLLISGSSFLRRLLMFDQFEIRISDDVGYLSVIPRERPTS